MPYLSLFIVLGFAGQWLLTSILIRKKGLCLHRGGFNFKIPNEVKKLIKSFSLCAIGVGAIQINSLLDALFARYTDPKGPIYLWYSIRMQQLALAILAIACINTIIPRLSRAIKEKNTEKQNTHFSFSSSRIFTLMIPCTFAILALGPSSTALLWGRNSFTLIGISKTTLCLWAYGSALLPAALTILYSSVCYAYDNFRTPTIASLVAVIFNLGMNAFFVFGLGLEVLSIAIATSLSSWINLLLLSKTTKKYSLQTNFPPKKIIELTIISSSACCVTILVDQLFFNPTLLPLLTNGEVHFSHLPSLQTFTFVTHFCIFFSSLSLAAIVCRNRALIDAFFLFIPLRSKTKKQNFS